MIYTGPIIAGILAVVIAIAVIRIMNKPTRVNHGSGTGGGVTTPPSAQSGHSSSHTGGKKGWGWFKITLVVLAVLMGFAMTRQFWWSMVTPTPTEITAMFHFQEAGSPPGAEAPGKITPNSIEFWFPTSNSGTATVRWSRYGGGTYTVTGESEIPFSGTVRVTNLTTDPEKDFAAWITTGVTLELSDRYYPDMKVMAYLTHGRR